MHVVIFEDFDWKLLAPLSLSRPTFGLMCGTSTLLEKQIRFLNPNRITLWVRPQLADFCRSQIAPLLPGSVGINQPLDGDPAWLLHGSTLFLKPESNSLKAGTAQYVAIDDLTRRIQQANVVSPGLNASDALQNSERWKLLLALPRTGHVGIPVRHIWDLCASNEQALTVDAAVHALGSVKLPDGPWHLINPDQVMIAAGVKLGPGCVIDASAGPVMLSNGAIIGANAVIQGPSFIGANTEIMPLTLIRPGTSIGPFCKLGGEVSRTIMIGYSNKAHEGYLGDSYVGEWVNLGAGTTTSNLKNTYGTIGMHLGGDEIDTGRKFLGSIIGDHTKTAIGTRFMSGSYVGYCAMIATSAHAPRFTRSFTFSTDRGTEPYRLQKAFDVARAMFARRERAWTAEDERLMTYAAQASEQAESA